MCIRDRDRTLVGPGVHVERAGDVVHLRCDLFGGHLVGPQIAQVVECQIQRSYLLENKEVNGIRSVERFRKKFEDDPATYMMIDRSTKVETETRCV